MKKTLLLLSAGLVGATLVGCGNDGPKTEPFVFNEAAFAANLVEFALDGELDWEGKGDFQQPANVYLSEDEYYTEGITTQHYFRNDSGNTIMKELTYENKIQEYALVYQQSQEFVPFAQIAMNPFMFVESVTCEDHVVTLTIDEEYSLIPFMVLVGLDAETTEFKITINDKNEPLLLTMTDEEYVNGDNTYTNFTYIANFLTKELIGVPVIEPYAAQNNTELDALFASLANANYTMCGYSSLVSEDEPNAIVKVTPNAALFNVQNVGNYAMFNGLNGEGLVQANVVTPGEGNAYLQYVENDEDLELADYLPSLFGSFSTDLFTKTGNKYHLNAAYESAQGILPDSLYQIMYMYMVEDSLDIEITPNGAIFTYDFNFIKQGTYKIEVTNIGTTTFPFDVSDPEQYHATVSASTWEELDGDVCADFFFSFFKDVDDFLPFYLPEGGYSYFEFFSGELQIEKETDTLEEAQEYFDAYYSDVALLMFSGWTDTINDEYHLRLENTELGLYIDVCAEEGFFGGAIFKIYVGGLTE